jgi:hypothetical protein
MQAGGRATGQGDRGSGEQWGYAEEVRKFRAFHGIDYLTALSLVCEIGDYQRFESAEACMPYRGQV